jgi:hypothetical protein
MILKETYSEVDDGDVKLRRLNVRSNDGPSDYHEGMMEPDNNWHFEEPQIHYLQFINSTRINALFAVSYHCADSNGRFLRTMNKVSPAEMSEELCYYFYFNSLKV